MKNATATATEIALAVASATKPGDVVTFRGDYDVQSVKKGRAYRVAGVDPKRNRLELSDYEGRAIV